MPLPRKPYSKPLGESRSQAVRRFQSLERSLHQKQRFHDVEQVIQEYMDLKHAEAVPAQDLGKDPQDVFYMPIHVVYKEASTTTKVRAVFDASAKSSSGMSLNDTLMVGPTVHSQLVDVLLRFRTHKVALTADISKMYRAVELTPSDKDYHRFVWRKEPDQPLRDYRMTRATFGVAASCFAANLCVQRNATELSQEYPLAARVAQDSLYVDDALTGAETIQETITLREQLQDLFSRGCFQLRKWNSSAPQVLESIPPTLREAEEILSISDSGTGIAKTLGIQWDTKSDSFLLSTSGCKQLKMVTKRLLLSDVARVFDALGWFSPATISMKILLQRLWELKIGWDDQVPSHILGKWEVWRSELPLLTTKHLERCYYLKEDTLEYTELHGFSDASEEAYAAVAYMKSVYTSGRSHVSIIMAKTKVAPLKRQSIPRLELCGALMLSRLLQHIKEVLQIPTSRIHAWTDSTIVLGWLCGSPRRFKTFVGNRVSEIMDTLPPDCWRHVPTKYNPADCASRGVTPAELLQHELWWEGPPWLKLDSSSWPITERQQCQEDTEELKITLTSVTEKKHTIVPFNKFSSYTRLVRVMAWTLRFIRNTRRKEPNFSTYLTGPEVLKAEQYLLKASQSQDFEEELAVLTYTKKTLPRASNLNYLFPFVDDDGIIRAGGRIKNSTVTWDQKHPVILRGKHPLTKLMIRSEHTRLLHAGPTLTFTSLSRKFHIIGGLKVVRTVTRQCDLQETQCKTSTAIGRTASQGEGHS